MDENETKFLAQELARTMGQIKRNAMRPTSWHGIKPSEFMLLHTLIHALPPDAKGMKVSDLSAHLQITPAGVTHTLNSLEEGGHIERLADPLDRRIVLVRPTAKSREMVESMHAQHVAFLQELIGFLGEKDSRELIRLLSLTLDYFRERRNRDADKSNRDGE